MTSLLPPEFNTVTLVGQYVNLDGSPVVGYLTFTPSPTILRASQSKDLIVPVTINVPLDGTGNFSVALPATDDPDINPDHWTYTVLEGFGNRRTYSVQILLEAGATQNIFDLAPVAIANGTYYELGPTGPAGPPAIISSGKPASSVGGTGDYAIDPVAGILYGPKSQASGWGNGAHLAAADIAAHAALATTHGVAGLLVGTTDTQTLSNKILRSPAVTGGLSTDTISATGDIAGHNITGNIVAANGATVVNAPVNATDVTNKTYVDGAVSGVQTQVTSNTTALGTKVQLGGDLGGTVTAPQVTSGTHHTHTSAQVSDATDLNTFGTIVKRDAGGTIKVQTVGIAQAVPTAIDQATRKDYVDGQDATYRRRLVNSAATAPAYTLALSDEGKAVYHTSLATTITVPTNATVAFPVGSWVDVVAGSAATTTIVPAAGVTLIGPDGQNGGTFTVRSPYSTVRLYKYGSDSWFVTGDAVNTVSQAVTAATSSPTASTLAKRDASGGLSLAYLDHSYAAAPASPTSGNGRLYLDSTYHTLSQVSSDGSVRYQQVYWGAVTAFPVSPYLKAGDTCYRTDIGANGTVFQYSGVGTNWVPESYPMLARLERTTSTPAYTAETVVTFDTGSGTFTLAQQTRVQFTLRGKNAVSISGNVARNQIYVVTGSTYPASVPAATRLTALFDKYIGNTLYGETISFEADVLLPAGTYTMALTLYGASGGAAAALNYEASSGPGLMPLSSAVLKALAIGTS